MKSCAKCREVKPYSEFSPRGRGYLSFCKKCKREANKDYYRRNRESCIARSKATFKDRSTRFFTWLSRKSCMDCGISDIRVLQFDHREGVNKRFIISEKIRHLAWDTLMKEVEKCDIVCANCHSIRTATRAGYYKKYGFNW